MRQDTGPWLAGRPAAGRGPAVEIRSPYDDALVGVVQTASGDDVTQAVAAAQRCFTEVMRELPAHRRAQILLRAADLLSAQTEELALLLARETGKPISLARDDPRRGADALRVAADSARSASGELVPMDVMPGGAGRFGFALRAPLGVVAAISPFNSPIYLSLQKVAPALAAGCTVVLKPPEAAPHTVLALGRIFAEAGLPDGALSILPGGPEVGAALVTHPDVAVVSFTGSGKVALQIQRLVGLKKVIYELGSNAPNIVCADADLDLAAQAIVASAYMSSGQMCTSAQRIYAHREVYHRLVERMTPLMRALQIGDPLREDVALGTLINEAAVSRIASWVAEAVAEGATVLEGGQRHPGGRNYLPTLLADVSPRMKVQCQEVFGPVATITPFDSDDEVLALANASDFGLRAGVFTRDLARALLYARRLEVGGLSINDSSRFRQENAPSSGIKGSGIGQEGGRYGYEEFTHLKFVSMRLGPP